MDPSVGRLLNNVLGKLLDDETGMTIIISKKFKWKGQQQLPNYTRLNRRLPKTRSSLLLSSRDRLKTWLFDSKHDDQLGSFVYSSSNECPSTSTLVATVHQWANIITMIREPTWIHVTQESGSHNEHSLRLSMVVVCSSTLLQSSCLPYHRHLSHGGAISCENWCKFNHFFWPTWLSEIRRRRRSREECQKAAAVKLLYWKAIWFPCCSFAYETERLSKRSRGERPFHLLSRKRDLDSATVWSEIKLGPFYSRLAVRAPGISKTFWLQKAHSSLKLQ